MSRQSPKLLVLTTSYPLNDDMVSGVFVRRLNSALDKYFQVETICPSLRGQRSDAANTVRYAPKCCEVLAHLPGGIPVALKANRWLILAIPFLLISLFLKSVVRLRDSDCLISHWAVSGMLGGLANIFYRRPSIVVFHGTDANSISSSKMNYMFAWLAVKLNQNVVAVSKNIESKLKENFPWASRRIVFIPNGVEDSLLDIERQGGSKLRLTTIANLNKLKGVHDVLEALAGIDDEFSFVVVGDGPEGQLLKEQAAKLSITSKVIFSGVVPSNKIVNVLIDTDIFVLASYSEGRPSVILEAMAAKTAICASRLPGIQELIEEEESGLLFEAGDVSMLRKCLSRLFDDVALRERLAANARAEIVNRGLTWNQTANRYQKLLRG